MKSIDSFRTLVRLQLILLPCDLILGLFALARRHIFFTVAAAYAIQILVVAANFVLLFLGFTATIPFRAGASNALFRDFAVPLGMGVVYLLALLAFRGYGAVGSSPCDNDRCDFWSDTYVVVMVIYQLAQVGYYYTMRRAIFKLCDSRYYVTRSPEK